MDVIYAGQTIISEVDIYDGNTGFDTAIAEFLAWRDAQTDDQSDNSDTGGSTGPTDEDDGTDTSDNNGNDNGSGSSGNQDTNNSVTPDNSGSEG